MIKSQKDYIKKVSDMYPDIPEKIVRRAITRYSNDMSRILDKNPSSFIIQRKKFFLKIAHPIEYTFSEKFKIKRTIDLVRRRKLEDIIYKNYV